jgi:aryl-alcohol dehydrogenase-like predicted oxidoreductase
MNSKAIIGTVQFGLDYGITNNEGKITDEQLEKIFDFCNTNNLKLFDTAQNYGISENILSVAKKKYPSFKIITKCKFEAHKGSHSECIRKSLDKFDEIECFMLHTFSDYQNKSVRDVLIEWKTHEKIKKVGVSVYFVEEAIILLEDNLIDVIQIPFNLLDKQWFRTDFQQLKRKRPNIEVHVRSIFLQGILLNKPQKYPVNIHKDEFLKLENILDMLCKNLNMSRLQVCFSFINSFDWINKFLIGIDNIEQLVVNENEMSKNTKLTESDLTFIWDKTIDIHPLIINPSKWEFN